MAKRPKPLGECKLCGNGTELRESHIVSKFLLRHTGLIGDKQRFAIHCHTDPSLTELYRQDGIKEYLLCDNCESRLGKWERYARRQLYGSGSPLNVVPSEGFIWRGLDYTQMKLFITSILWRMSISTHPFYGFVDLGEQHGTRMRQMFLREDARETWRYGCFVGFLQYGPKPLGGIFSQPQRFRTDGSTCYRFIMAGLVWFIYANSHRSPTLPVEGFLQTDGSWAVPKAHALAIPFVKDEIDRYREFAKTQGISGNTGS